METARMRFTEEHSNTETVIWRHWQLQRQGCRYSRYPL